jgi:hypothetical protein
MEIEVADLDSVDLYLYEINTGYSSTDAEQVQPTKLFDLLDFIFIDGDANLMPWCQRACKVRARQFLILIRMAKKSHKVLFAGTMGMHF